MVKFREKIYGEYSSSAVKGAGVGAAIGVSLSSVAKGVIGDKKVVPVMSKLGDYATEGTIKIAEALPKKVRKMINVDSLTNILNKISKTGNVIGSHLGDILSNPKLAMGVGTLIGAAVALGWFIMRKSYNKIDQKSIKLNSTYGIENISSHLIAKGFRPRRDYAIDPESADYIKTRVSIIIDRGSDDLCLTINAINDPKLEKITSTIIKELPTESRYYSKITDKANELIIHATSSDGGNSAYVADIAEKFLKKKYPVYLIEVN